MVSTSSVVEIARPMSVLQTPVPLPVGGVVVSLPTFAGSAK